MPVSEYQLGAADANSLVGGHSNIHNQMYDLLHIPANGTISFPSDDQPIILSKLRIQSNTRQSKVADGLIFNSTKSL